MADIKPCPFCGSTDLKHYVTSASGGRYRGVIVCKKCGVRNEAYSDYTHVVSEAYCGDWKEADVFTREQARNLVEREWNRRAGECDRDALLDVCAEIEDADVDGCIDWPERIREAVVEVVNDR